MFKALSQHLICYNCCSFSTATITTTAIPHVQYSKLEGTGPAHRSTFWSFLNLGDVSDLTCEIIQIYPAGSAPSAS